MSLKKEQVFQFIVIGLLVVAVYLVFKDDKAKAPAGYMDKQSIYEMDTPIYPEVGVVPSQADVYQKLDNCYQNGGVYDFNRNICRYDYQNMAVINQKGYTNPQGKIVQEFAYQANRLPINSNLPV